MVSPELPMKFKATIVIVIFCGVLLPLLVARRVLNSQDLFGQFIGMRSEQEAQRFLDSLTPDQLLIFARQACTSWGKPGKAMGHPRWYTTSAFHRFRIKNADLVLNEKLVAIVTDRNENGMFRAEALFWLAKNAKSLSPGDLHIVLDACYRAIADKDEVVEFRVGTADFISGGLFVKTKEEIDKKHLLVESDKKNYSDKYYVTQVAKERGFVNPFQGDIDNAVKLFLGVITNNGEREEMRSGIFRGLSLCLTADPLDSLRSTVKAELIKLIEGPKTPALVFFHACDILVRYYDVRDLANPQTISLIEARMALPPASKDPNVTYDGQRLIDELKKRLAEEQKRATPKK